MKIVKNACYGGFGLSPKATKRLAELQGRECYFFKGGLSTPWEKMTLEEAEASMFSYTFSISNPNELLTREEVGGIEANKRYNEIFNKYYIESSPKDRTDPLLIQVVEELGKEANSEYSNLQIVEIPDDIEWEIDEHDGYETIREKNRSW